MSISGFLENIGFSSYGSVVNSWDAFSESGSVLMQLWADAGKRVHDPLSPNAYIRILCFDATHYKIAGNRYKVGYAGRMKAISCIENGVRGYAALSSPSGGKRGPGVWAKHADLSKVYPVLAIERDSDNGDIIAVIGKPIRTDDII